MKNITQKLKKLVIWEYTGLQGLAEDKQQYTKKQAQTMHKNNAWLALMQ